jgi:hypothetical protein
LDRGLDELMQYREAQTNAAIGGDIRIMQNAAETMQRCVRRTRCF